MKQIELYINEGEGIVLAEFAYADVDRLNSFFRIAKKDEPCLAVSLRQPYLLEALRTDRGLSVPNLNDENVLIFRKSKERRDRWEGQVSEQHTDKVINEFEASKQQCKAVLALSLYDFEELVEIQP